MMNPRGDGSYPMDYDAYAGDEAAPPQVDARSRQRVVVPWLLRGVPEADEQGRAVGFAGLPWVRGEVGDGRGYRKVERRTFKTGECMNVNSAFPSKYIKASDTWGKTRSL
jgi:hypothetical protein